MDSSKITVLIPTSAIPSHPDTVIMDETIAGIRHHLPDSLIIILADGVWNKLEHRRGQYEEYLNRISNRYPNTNIFRLHQHTQQTAMAQYAIQNFVQTELVFWNEQDAPLNLRPINWDSIVHEVESGNAGLVRFSIWEQGIHEAHEHMARGRYQIGEDTFVRTTQFSGWSFLTTRKFFINKIFNIGPIGKEMLELRMHDRCANAPWEDYRMCVYIPPFPSNRMRHSNGRGFGVEERDPCDWQGQ